MIPKIIHYCWFGEQPKSNEVEEYIQGWKNINPDFQIIEWNEKNFDVNINFYVAEAYKAKKWAFVSDYARLCVLYKYGGVYLDTDVEIIKPLSPFLFSESFLGIESEFSICTAVIGAEKESQFIFNVLRSYDNEHFIKNDSFDITPNSQRIYAILTKNDSFDSQSKDVQNLVDCVVYPQDYFSPINCYTGREKITARTVAIHRYAGTWKTKSEKIKDSILVVITRVIGEKNRQKIKRIMKGKQ